MKLQTRDRNVKAFLLSVLTSLTVLVQSCVTDSEPASRLGVGDPLPSFSVVLSTGETVSSQTLKGETAVIEFFNTGCGDCRLSLPVVQAAYDSLKGDPHIVFLCIAREESLSQIENYWRSNSLTLPFSAQPDRKVYSLFATEGIPRLYISGPDARIKATFGPDDQPSLPQLINLLR